MLLNQLLESALRTVDPGTHGYYHHLGAETPVHAFVDRLLAYLPDVLHVILISRKYRLSGWPACGRIRRTNHNRSELSLLDEETRQLFAMFSI